MRYIYTEELTCSLSFSPLVSLSGEEIVTPLHPAWNCPTTQDRKKGQLGWGGPTKAAPASEQVKPSPSTLPWLPSPAEGAQVLRAQAHPGAHAAQLPRKDNASPVFKFIVGTLTRRAHGLPGESSSNSVVLGRETRAQGLTAWSPGAGQAVAGLRGLLQLRTESPTTSTLTSQARRRL